MQTSFKIGFNWPKFLLLPKKSKLAKFCEGGGVQPPPPPHTPMHRGFSKNVKQLLKQKTKALHGIFSTHDGKSSTKFSEPVRNLSYLMVFRINSSLSQFKDMPSFIYCQTLKFLTEYTMEFHLSSFWMT